MDGSHDVRRAYRQTAIVCSALVASVLIYAAVVEVLGGQLRPGGVTGDVPPVRYVFYLVAGVQGLAIPFVRRAAEAVVPGSAIARLRRGAVVAASLAEAPALLGLLLFLLAGRRADFYVLAGWSLLLQIFHFPRLERWEETVRTAAHRRE